MPSSKPVNLHSNVATIALVAATVAMLFGGTTLALDHSFGSDAGTDATAAERCVDLPCTLLGVIAAGSGILVLLAGRIRNVARAE